MNISVSELQQELCNKIFVDFFIRENNTNINTSEVTEKESKKTKDPVDPVIEDIKKIVEQLKDHINEPFDYGEQKNLTVLDYIILADGKCTSTAISQRERINNQNLIELENYTREVGGKTSEELGIPNTLISTPDISDEIPFPIAIMRNTSEQVGQVLTEIAAHLNRQMVREIYYNFSNLALFTYSSYLLYTSIDKNDNGKYEVSSMPQYLIGTSWNDNFYCGASSAGPSLFQKSIPSW